MAERGNANEVVRMVRLKQATISGLAFHRIFIGQSGEVFIEGNGRR